MITDPLRAPRPTVVLAGDLDDFDLRPARTRQGSYDPRRRESATPTVSEAVEAMLRHRGDWREPTRRNCRHYLCGRRWRAFCARAGITTVEQLTTDHVEAFLDAQRTQIKPKTREGYRRYLRALAAFQMSVPGYGSGLADMGRVKKPPMARTPAAAPSLSVEEEDRAVRGCRTARDRLLVELMLATGLRNSEACALVVSDLHLDPRQGHPYLHVRGSIWDPDLTKSEEDRKAPLRPQYASLAARLRSFCAAKEPSDYVFTSQRGQDERGRPAPLGTSGVVQICARLSERVGFHVHPHLLRHTWATRCVDANIAMFHLQQAGGWKSIEMVRRYYRADARETLDAFARSRA